MPRKFIETGKICESRVNLLAFMYAGFQKLDPSLNAGIDFSREYEHARQLLEGKPG
jgi:hypothetical protein